MNANFQVDYQYIEVEYMCPYDGGTARAFRVELNMRLHNGAWTTRKAVIPVPWDAPLVRCRTHGSQNNVYGA